MISDISLPTTASTMAEDGIRIVTASAGIPNITFLYVALLQICSSATHFFWIFPLALIPYPGFNFIPLFWVADIIGSTDGDVWDEVASSPTHLS